MAGIANPSSEAPPPRKTVERSGTRIVVLEGCLDLACTAQLRVALDDSLSQSDNVRVDLSRVSYLDSTGVRELLRAQAHAAQKEKTFGVVAPSDAVRRLLDVADAAGLLRDR